MPQKTNYEMDLNTHGAKTFFSLLVIHHPSIHRHLHSHTHAYTHTCIHTHTRHTHAHTHANTFAQTHANTFAQTHTRKYTHANTHAYTSKHTRTHANTCTPRPAFKVLSMQSSVLPHDMCTFTDSHAPAQMFLLWTSC